MPRIIGYLIVAFWFSSTCANGQHQKLIDSLEVALGHKAGKDRVNYVVDVAIEFVDKDNNKALAIMELAEKIALQVGDSLSIARCFRIKGQVLLRLQRSDEAVNMLQLSLAISDRHRFDRERMSALVSYAVIFIERSQYDKGLRDLTTAHDLAVSLMDTAYMEAALNNLGVVYYKLKDYSKALHYWEASAESHLQRNASSFKEHLNMSLAYANLNDFTNARRSLDDCVALCGEGCTEEALMHINYASGVIFMGLNDYENAEIHLIKSYRLSEKTQDVRMMLDNIYLLTDIYQKQHRTDLALSHLKKGQAIINRGVEFNLEIIKIYRRFADLYLGLQNYKLAAIYQSRYIHLKDSIYNEDLTTSLMKAEANYLERYNKAQIASQKELISLKEGIIVRQERVTVLAILLTLVTVACCLFLYWSYRYKQAMNRLLEARIRERTFELERSRNELLSTLRERDLIIARAEREAVETVKTISGLCQTAREERDPIETYSYLERIENTSGRLQNHLYILFSKGKEE